MQQGHTCPNCGVPLWFVNQYQSWYCEKCMMYPFIQPMPMPYYPPPKSGSSSTIIIVVVFVVFLFIILPLIFVAMFFIATPGIMTPVTTSPTGAMSFTEFSPGNYTGGIISLSDILNLDEVSLLVIDDSQGGFAQINPLEDDRTSQVPNGVGCTFNDANNNDRLDAADIITIFNGAPGDTIRLFHRPSDDLIAENILI